MDATTILAITSCVILFCGWLVLPHSPAKQTETVTAERKPVRLSA